MTIHVKDTCKIGQGNACCRYLVMASKGFECAKLSSLRLTLDTRAENKQITAQGDNCDGYSPEQSINILNEDV